ncbi:MAG TPA: hypothetical protein PLP63_06560 [Saprospiraceae bacterium]|nr:hypothetical protein [Saprospiraceae bacterium]
MKKGKVDILVYTAMNDRHTVSRLFCMSMKRFIDNFRLYSFKVFAVVSKQESVDMCNEFKFDSFLTENSPLGRKFNKGLEVAMERYDFNYVLIMGDDDILLDKAALYYHRAIKKNVLHGGLGALYFWKPSEHKAMNYSYTTRGLSDNKLIGCGRIIHKEAIEAAGWRQDIQISRQITQGKIMGKISPGFVYQFSHKISKYLCDMKFGRIAGEPYFGLWDDQQEKALDNESEMKLIFAGYMPEVITPKDESPLAIDVKTGANIWPFERYSEYGEDVNELELIGQISRSETQYIDENLR